MPCDFGIVEYGERKGQTRKAPSKWTAKDEAELRKLWLQTNPQLSAQRIGALIGRNKNQVIGKINRMKLPRRPSPIIRDYNTMSKAEKREAIEQKAQDDALEPPAREAPKPVSEAVQGMLGINRLAATDGMKFRGCQWIKGIPTKAAMRDDSCKCGEPPVNPFQPYCDYHRSKAFNATTKPSESFNPDLRRW